MGKSKDKFKVKGTAGHEVISGHERRELGRRVGPERLLLSDLPADTITHVNGRLRASSCCDHGNNHQKWLSRKRQSTVWGDE